MFSLKTHSLWRSKVWDKENSVFLPKSFIWSHPKFTNSKAVSFCVFAEKSQLETLAKTMKQNLIDTQMDRESVEFVILLDTNSTTSTMFAEQFSEEVKNGAIQIFWTTESLGKKLKNNMVFQLAKSKILSLLQFDEYVGPRASNYIYNSLNTSGERRVVWLKKWGRKSNRLSLTKDLFYEMGGFDESLSASRQVIDLVRRLKGYNVNVSSVSIEMFSQGIEKDARGFSFLTPKSGHTNNKMTSINKNQLNQVLPE